MMKKLENISAFILSETAIKIIGLVLAFLIILNCAFLPLLTNITSNDLSTFSNVQKDIFSTVFFVSNTIEQINFSLTSNIFENNTKSSDTQNKENQNIPCTDNDFIITGLQIQNEMLKLQYNQSNNLISYNSLIYDYNYLSTNFYVLYNKILLILACIFLFFASIKKLYDNIFKSNINRKNPAFMHI